MPPEGAYSLRAVTARMRKIRAGQLQTALRTSGDLRARTHARTRCPVRWESWELRASSQVRGGFSVPPGVGIEGGIRGGKWVAKRLHVCFATLGATLQNARRLGCRQPRTWRGVALGAGRRLTPGELGGIDGLPRRQGGAAARGLEDGPWCVLADAEASVALLRRPPGVAGLAPLTALFVDEPLEVLAGVRRAHQLSEVVPAVGRRELDGEV